MMLRLATSESILLDTGASSFAASACTSCKACARPARNSRWRSGFPLRWEKSIAASVGM